mgnify:CR=1 FL=1
MTINRISNNAAIRLQNVASKPNIETQTATKPVQNINNNANQNSSLSPLSSRYTYAIGRDGKRYILQLRIDIASVRAFSALA